MSRTYTKAITETCRCEANAGDNKKKDRELSPLTELKIHRSRLRVPLTKCVLKASGKAFASSAGTLSLYQAI